MSTVQAPLNTGTLFEPLLTSHEVAALLRIHQKTLESMARAGLVPATKKGKSWVFRLSSLSAWIDWSLTQTLPIGVPNGPVCLNWDLKSAIAGRAKLCASFAGERNLMRQERVVSVNGLKGTRQRRPQLGAIEPIR
jgi:excisionase family DNA binding protein